MSETLTDSCSAASDSNVGAVGNSSVPKYVPPHRFAGKSEEENVVKNDRRVEGSTRTMRTCRFYDNGRSCRFGEKCRYLHSDASAHTTKSQNKPCPQEEVSGRSVQNQAKSSNDTDEEKLQYQGKHGKKTEEYEEIAEDHNYNNNGKQNERICRYFARTKHCFYGDKCKFKHILETDATSKRQKQKPNRSVNPDAIPRVAINTDEFPVVSTPDGTQELNSLEKDQENHDSQQISKDKISELKVCRYFKAGRCTRGQHCRFSHPSDSFSGNIPKTDGDVSGTQKSFRKAGSQKHQPYQRASAGRPNAAMVLDKLTPEELSQHRKTEIQQLQKRYPKAETLPPSAEDEKCYDGFKVTFQPTDPDWPYDVKEVLLDVYFPKDYPKDALKIKIGEDERIPEVVRRHIEFAVNEWVKQRYESQQKNRLVELIFRPLLRWLDRKLEDIFTEGLTQYKRELVARAAGIEFIPASELQEKYRSSSTPEECGQDGEEVEEDDVDLGGNVGDDGNKNEVSCLNNEEIEAKTEESGNYSSIDPIKRGTEIKLANLQLKESAATLLGIQIHLVVQCIRCKHQSDVVTPGDRVNQAQCGRCGHSMLVTYRPAMVHQFASVLGYVDLDGCSPFDLILSESQFNIGCLGCSKEMKMMGLPPGHPKDTWCQHCHEKMRFAVECVRFQQLQPAQQIDTSNIHMVTVQKVRKVMKDPAIQEGKPLPANGTCKHYKKSYRWLRFPCCGKTYPCDLCHDEKELDHEMKYANRMICGFCCKEQPYAADRPCVACDSNMTKKAGTHWEGGQGCRDKIKMAKGDAQKYAGTKKTISRKAQSALPEKKTTKLRHA